MVRELWHIVMFDPFMVKSREKGVSFPGASISFQVSFLQCGYFPLLAINQQIEVHIFVQLPVRLEYQAGSSVRLQCQAAVSSVKA